MIKTILVPATGAASDEVAFQAALGVASLFGGHLEFLHVRPSPGDLAANLAVDGSVGLSVGLIEKLEEEAAQIEERAHKAFQRFAQQARLAVGATVAGAGAVSAAWRTEIGREEDWLPEHGRTSDLIVIGRPAKGEAASRASLETALLESGRPILIPDGRPLALDSLAIAWKSTREGAHAVVAAMPFMAKAKRVTILTVDEEGQEDQPAAARLLAALRRHHAAVELRRLQPRSLATAQVLLSGANELGAGLLVMGGYGHSRLREWVFGGVTEYMLRNAALPILMAH